MRESAYVVPHRLTLPSPYLSDYFGVWAIHEPTFRALVEKCDGMNLHAHLQSADVMQSVAERDSRSFQLTEDGLAILSIRGPMMKAVSSMADGTSTVRLRQQLREAKRDPNVKGGLLVLDTPGGTVSGNRDLADEVAAFAAVKPIYAFTEDLTASAGVSIASQATKRYANQPTALYGAMGTYGVVLDLSGRAEQLGIKVHVIRAGAFKGMGTEGTAITDEQLAEMQRNINAMNEGYLETIARGLGRSIETIRPLADGRVHTATEAVAMGLIDGVQSYEATYKQLVAATRSLPVSVPPVRSSNTMEKTPATLATLKATFPNSSADWRESQLEAGNDLAGASVAYATFVEKQAADREALLKKQLEEANAKANAAPKPAGNTLGHRPLGSRPTSAAETDAENELTLETGDALCDFNDAVAKAMGHVRGPVTLERRQAAIRQVARKQPALYKAYLLSQNSSKRAARLIEEKLEAVAK